MWELGCGIDVCASVGGCRCLWEFGSRCADVGVSVWERVCACGCGSRCLGVDILVRVHALTAVLRFIGMYISITPVM